MILSGIFPRDRTFLGLLATGILFRVILLLFIPLYPENSPLPGYNDEPMHLQYVREIASTGRIPVWTEQESRSNPLIDEYPQSPLYYLLAALPYKLGETIRQGWGIYCVRFLSVMLGILGALFVRLAAFRFSNNLQVADSAFAFALLSPNMVLFTSIVTNDAALIALSGIAFFCIFRFELGTGSDRKWWRLGSVLATSVWAKISGISLLPLGFFAGLGLAGKTLNWKEGARILGMSLVICAPLFGWNYWHYGSLVPTTSIYTPAETLGLSEGGLYHPVMAIKYFLRTAAQPLEGAWGGGAEKMTTVIWVATFGGLLLIGWRELLRSKKRGYQLIFYGLALSLLALAAYNFRFFQMEARLLAPAAAPVSIMIAYGAERVGLPVWGVAGVCLLPILGIVM
jgi:4-amino-4-deoxy-L-arabinose transferase-like glycosyltransferase